MDETFDKRKMIEILVDPDVSIILSELEDGGKESVYLTQIANIRYRDKKRLAYVIQHGFVMINQNENKIMEMDENFSGVVDGLTELDQYLN